MLSLIGLKNIHLKDIQISRISILHPADHYLPGGRTVNRHNHPLFLIKLNLKGQPDGAAAKPVLRSPLTVTAGRTASRRLECKVEDQSVIRSKVRAHFVSLAACGGLLYPCAAYGIRIKCCRLPFMVSIKIVIWER